ncbi:MAG: glycosyltransferase, partial [Burkholderiales bacterium]|nr:glycosyltransferase [Burkholderiales bacterium]
MRILIDLQGCQSGSRFGGIGRYSMSLAKAMLRLNSRHEFCLLLNSRLPNENLIRAEFADLMPQQNILTFEVPAFVAAENNLPVHTRIAELIREKRIAEIDPDVVHIASLFEGAGEDVVTSVGMLFPASRTAVTLYDLIPYLEQETYLTNQMLSDHYLNKFDNLKRAGMILAISDFSRVEALENTDIPSDHIVNVSSAVDSQFAPSAMDEASKLALLGKSGIEKPFLLFTGSFDSRKNHDRLVEAFAKIPLALRGKYQLVIIGKGTIDQVSRLRALGRDHGLGEHDLVFVGHVNDADLVAFYNLCALFV